MPNTNAVSTPNPVEPRVRPPQVSLASLLLCGSLLLGFVTSALLRSYLPSGAQALFIQVFTFAVMALLIYLIWAGHNWARITFTVLFALGMVFYIPTLKGFFQFSFVAGALNLVQTLLQVVALYLLFTGPGRDWFKPRSGVA
jgi:hypothetical protein